MEMKGVKSKLLFVFFLLLACGLMDSCVDTRKTTYFNGVSNGTLSTNTPIPISVIQRNDLLSITISSLNPEASAFFNTLTNSPGTSANPSQPVPMPGYLVSPEGTIQFPILGTIKVQGLTTNQLKETIRSQLVDKKLLTDPIVTVRFLDFKVTVLGEVSKPTVITVPDEKISLLEAIGLAGDLTIYARRDNVLVIREGKDDGSKVLKRINLNSPELLSSDYYYLKSNDIVYVEPNKAKISSAGRGKEWIPIILSGLSLGIIVVETINNNHP
jgi:polysaccharide export outer membrane protein